MAFRSVFGNRDLREKKVLTNRDYYKTLIESKKEATFLCDAEGDLFLLNKKAQVMTGFGEDEIREYHIRDLFVTQKSVDNQLDVRQFTEFTSRLYLLDSHRYLIPVVFDFKEIEGQKFLCTCVEVEENESPARSRESASVLSAEPSLSPVPQVVPDSPVRWPVEFEHKVRNLMSSILGFGSILSREPAITADKNLASSLESLMRSGNQLRKLFNQLSPGTGDSHEVNRMPVYLSPIIQKAVILLEPLANQHNVEIKAGRHADVKVLTDEVLLLDMLKFLIEKAITYTRRDEVLIEVTEERSSQRITVSIDNVGHDFPQGVINYLRRENLKDKYDLTNPLVAQNPEVSMILHTMNRIDGKLTFLSGQTSGEIVQIILPMASETDSVDEMTMLENILRGRSLKILIIEDDKLTARILNMFIDKITEVSVAYSGNEALNIIESFYNKGIIFHAVISDIGLPVPWDGILLKQEIERRWPEYQNVPFLAQTAFTSKSYADRIIDCGFRSMLIKPTNRSDILLFLDKYCR